MSWKPKDDVPYYTIYDLSRQAFMAERNSPAGEEMGWIAPDMHGHEGWGYVLYREDTISFRKMNAENTGNFIMIRWDFENKCLDIFDTIT